ncbi:MAG: hypothetical protein QNJ29_10730 [Rhizobiaceae bacterium]|nr:hypothetical protein [Rhizobiaceae bacterium]
MEKITDAEPNTVVTAFSRNIDKLGKDKLIEAEKFANGIATQIPFDGLFQLAL